MDKEVINETERMEDSDEDSSGDEDNVMEKRAEELEAALSENKYLYDAHVELVGLYKKLTDLNSMRSAYERFRNVYPLTPDLWLEWLKDEVKLTVSEEEKKDVLKLFETATKDYLSVKLWLEYAQFSLGVSELDETRRILEQGLNVAGLHVAQGSLLWDTLRELEVAHLSLLEPDSEAFETQLLKVLDVFKRQLSVPLLNASETYKEYTEFKKELPEDKYDGKDLEWGYKNALKQLQICKPYEDKLMMNLEEAEILSTYREYIKAVNDPSLKLCLYERAVEKLAINPDIWLDYCYYAYTLGQAAEISERALRNVSWNPELWSLALRILEKNGKDNTEMIAFFEKGIVMLGGSSIDFWLSYLDYTRRTNPDKLSKLFEQAEQIDANLDRNHKIKRFHARLTASAGKMESARKIWNSILHDQRMKKSAHNWMEYLNLERQFGTTNQFRVLCKRAVDAVQDWPRAIADEWLNYEREHGSPDDIVKCMTHIRYVQDAVRQPEPVVTITKRKSSDAHEPKKRFKEQLPKRNQGPPVNLDPLKSVFLSNLSPETSEAQLSALFPNGQVTLSTNNKGESRCFGYVQFGTENEASETLTRDRETVNERPMFVSKCKSDKTEKVVAFKYADTVEKNKLFVRGLPIKHRKEDVQAIFEPYNCTNVRLVLHRSGQPKGLAYVDFPDEVSAEKALKETDGMTIGRFAIKVAISSPPVKKKGDHRDEEEIDRHVRTAPSRRLTSFKPTVLQRNEHKREVVEAEEEKNGSAKAPKSNDDFRKMFLS